MNVSLLGIGGFLKSLQASMIAWGGLGLFFIALLDSALVPVPGGPDVVVIALSHHTHTFMPVYVMIAVAGSTVGSLFLYWIAFRGGEAVLSRFTPEKRARAMRFVDRFDMWALLIGAVLPPPFPFKLLVLSAGAFRMRLTRFLTALVLGRGFRFTIEGIAAVRYGESAIEIVKRNYPVIGLGVAGVIVALLLVNSLFKRRKLVRAGM
jgi:membrane protein YqaA with SNARE-associated domain